MKNYKMQNVRFQNIKIILFYELGTNILHFNNSHNILQFVCSPTILLMKFNVDFQWHEPVHICILHNIGLELHINCSIPILPIHIQFFAVVSLTCLSNVCVPGTKIFSEFFEQNGDITAISTSSFYYIFFRIDTCHILYLHFLQVNIKNDSEYIHILHSSSCKYLFYQRTSLYIRYISLFFELLVYYIKTYLIHPYKRTRQKNLKNIVNSVVQVNTKYIKCFSK